MIRSVVPSGPPAWPMCTGVMTITPTITAWETTTAVSPSRPPGEAHTARTAAPVAPRGRDAGPVAAEPSREQQGVRAQQQARTPAPTRTNTTAETAKAPPRTGRPSAAPRSAPGPARFGPRTEPIVVAQTTRDRSRPRRSGDGEIGGGVARLQAARRGRAEAEQADQEQREGGQGRGDDRQHGAEDGDRVAGRQPRPSAATVADPRERDGDHGRAEHAGRLPEPRGGVGAGDVAGEQPADGDADGHAESAEGDAPAEDADGAALDDEGVDHRGRGHSPSERPMISFMISFVPP